jgi:sugar O-acyltransferase (sialic acid O-acetyltransferase NeuD family)
VTSPDQANNLIIVGDSLFAQVAHECFTRDSEYTVVAFAVERAHRNRDELFGLPVVDFEDLEDWYPPESHSVYAALIYTELNRLRTRLAATAKDKGFRLASYVSGDALVWPNVTFGEHCFVFEGNIVQPFVSLGDNVVLWSGGVLSHHVTVDANCFLAPRVAISGSSHIGESCFLGVNSTVVNDVEIGRDSWIGPGVTVTANVPAASFIRPPRPQPSRATSFEELGLDSGD